METLSSFIAGLDARGIILSNAEGGKLRFRSSGERPTERDRSYIDRRRAEIASYLAAKSCGATAPLTKADGPVRPSPTQAFWWEDMGEFIPLRTIDQFVIRIDTPIADESRSIDAIRRLLAAQPSLRLRFAKDGTGLAAGLNDIGDAPIAVRHCETVAECEASHAAFARQAMRITDDWLFAAQIGLCRAAGSAILSLRAHHMIFDAFSARIVRAEIERGLGGNPAAPDESALGYLDYAAWQAAHFASPAGRAYRAFWNAWSRGLPEVRTPAGTRLDWRLSSGAGFHAIDFSEGETIAIRHALGALRIHPSLFFQAVYGLALCRWTNSERLGMRLVRDARIDERLADAAGLLLTFDAVEVSMHGVRRLSDLVRSLSRENALAREFSVPGRITPLEDRDIHSFHSRLAATYNYAAPALPPLSPAAPAAPAALTPPVPMGERISYPSIRDPLYHAVSADGGRFRAIFGFNGDLFPNDLPRCFMETYAALLLTVIRDPEAVLQ